MADRIGQYMHAHTLYGSYRPFGSSIILASHDVEGYHLHMIEPSGHNYVNNFIHLIYFFIKTKFNF